jgi:DNA-binding NtrC family response regulator
MVDDDEYFCETIKYLLEKNNYVVTAVNNADKVMDVMADNAFDLVLLDLKIGEKSGLDVLPKIKEYDKNVIVIMVTELDSATIAVEAIKKGAYDYLIKSIDDKELLLKINRALDKHEDLIEIQALKNTLVEQYGFGNLLGKNKKMQDIYTLVKKICRADATVLICGETGCGKELIAKAVHFNSVRKDKPFVAVNCAAISENLMESELFGHEKGAFTGAIIQKKGKVEIANAGTLFLDEIGDMSINLQAKLLRFLQDRTFDRVGGTDQLKADVRVLAATNRDLPELIKKNLFREDLYYRLNAIQIKVPSLRDRRDDIPLLIEAFIKRSNIKYSSNVQIKDISEAILKKMEEYPWPGNVRELENFIDQLVLLADNDKISDEKAIAYLQTPQQQEPQEMMLELDKSLKDAREIFEEQYIAGLLEKYHGNIKLVSEKADVDRRIIYDKMKKYNLTKESFKTIDSGDEAEE